MGEDNNSSSDPEFSKIAASRSEGLFFNDGFEPTLGELVNDGVYHPLNFLKQTDRDESGLDIRWKDVKGLLLPIYRDFRDYMGKGYGKMNDWPNPLENGLFPSDINLESYGLASKYVSFLRGPEIETKAIHTKDVSGDEMQFLKHEVNGMLIRGNNPLEYLTGISDELTPTQYKELLDYIANAQDLAKNLQVKPRENRHAQQ